MRIAVISDIHGNLTAFEAVLADLRQTAPDLILHGGDLADSGSSPIEIVDRIRALGWLGVMGNTDEMLVRPESLENFASQSTAPPLLWAAVRQIAEATRSLLGAERVAWLSQLPQSKIQGSLALVHASPESCWRAPVMEAPDNEIEAIYTALHQPIVVYGHIHRPFVRNLSAPGCFLVNTGSIGLSYDGDPRASYLLLDENIPSIRRVSYEVEKELRLLKSCGLPHANWTAKILRTSSAQLP